MAQPVSMAVRNLRTTDYGIDKIVFRKPGSTFVPKASSMADSVLVAIPHGLPFTPLPIGAYSVDGFLTSQDFGTGTVYFDGVQYGTDIFGNLEADSTYVYVLLISFAAARTFNYRVVCLPPSDAPSNTFNRPDRSGGLLFSSDDNYLKIYKQGVININDSGAFGFENYPVDHNLGYIPTSLVFTEWSGRVRQIGSENSIGVSGIDAFAYLTTDQLVMSVDPYFAGLLRLHYKVYLDG